MTQISKLSQSTDLTIGRIDISSSALKRLSLIDSIYESEASHPLLFSSHKKEKPTTSFSRNNNSYEAHLNTPSAKKDTRNNKVQSNKTSCYQIVEDVEAENNRSDLVRKLDSTLEPQLAVSTDIDKLIKTIKIDPKLSLMDNLNKTKTEVPNFNNVTDSMLE